MKYNVFVAFEPCGDFTTFPDAVEVFLKEVRACLRFLRPCHFENGYYILVIKDHGTGTISMSLSITEVMQLCEEFNVIDDGGDVRKGLSIDQDLSEQLFRPSPERDRAAIREILRMINQV